MPCPFLGYDTAESNPSEVSTVNLIKIFKKSTLLLETSKNSVNV
jgi:hypothetical protein